MRGDKKNCKASGEVLTAASLTIPLALSRWARRHWRLE